MKKVFILLSVLTSLILITGPVSARHGSNVFVGGMMGAGIGAMAGGHDGIVPGLMTGLAAGTAAEMIEDAHDHRHCHEHIVYTEARPSRTYLEEQIDRLEYKLYKEQERANYLEHQLAKLERKVEQKEAEIHHLQKQLKSKDTPEIIFSAKAVTV